MMKPVFTMLITTLAAFTIILPPAFAGADMSRRLNLSEGTCVSKTQSLIADGKIKEAVENLEKFISRTQSASVHPYLHFLLGNTYSTLSQDYPQGEKKAFQKAIQCYQNAIRTDPGFTEAWLNLARCAYELQDFKNAATAFQKGYDCSETKKAVHLYYAAVCRFQAQESKKALALFGHLLKNHPEQVSLAWKEVLINIYFSLEQFRNALPFVEELAQKSPTDKKKKWQEILLQQYLNLEIDARALALAKDLTRSDPLEPRWWKALSHIHLKSQRHRDGLTALMIYGFLTPMTKQELQLAADLYLSLDIPTKAAGLYQQVLEQEHDPKTLKKLTQAFAMAYDPDNAILWIDKGLSTPKNSPDKELIKMKAQLLYMKRSWEKAAAAFEKAALQYKKDKKAGGLWLMVGHAALNGKRFEQAKKAFQKAAAYKKQHKDAIAAIRQIESMYTAALQAPSQSQKQ